MGLRTEQGVIFGTLFLGYALFILCRKSFSFLLPAINASQGLDNQQLGTIVSAQNVAYAISKFSIGVLSDRVSARILFSLGLLGTGMSVMAFANTDSFPLFVLFWFLNGLLAGFGWPAVSKLLIKWFRPEQFGTMWSLLSASINVTGALVPLALPWFVHRNEDWRSFMFYSGLVSSVWGFASFALIRNSPAGKDSSPEKEAKKPEETISLWRLLVGNSFIASLSAYYLVVFGVRTSVENWGQLLLVKEMGLNKEAGGQFLSAFETGGFISSLLTGYITDWAVARQKGKEGNARMGLGTVYMFGTVIAIQSILLFKRFLPVFAFALGAFLYGNINIFGIVAVECAPAHLSGSSHAIVALAGSVGAVGAGLPVTVAASYVGWIGVFYLLELAAAISVIFMLLPKPKRD